MDKSPSWPLRWLRMVTGILLELKRVKKLIKSLINEENSDRAVDGSNKESEQLM